MRYFIFIIPIAWLAACTKSPSIVLPPSSDEYEVCTAVIDSVCHKRNFIVIDDSTESLNSLIFDHSSPDLGHGTSPIYDLVRKDSARWALHAASFGINRSLLMLNSKKLEFSEARGNIKWTEFRKEWDGHYLVFSRVGFGSSHDQAVLHLLDIGVPMGGSEGSSTGWWITLEKSGGHWVIRKMSTSFPV